MVEKPSFGNRIVMENCVDLEVALPVAVIAVQICSIFCRRLLK